MGAQPLHIVVMGVSGSGKTTLARTIAERTGRPLLEADDLHPAENLAILQDGKLPGERARIAWLDMVREWMDGQAQQGHSTIVACTALTKAHRERLNEADGVVFYVHLYGTEDVLADRMARRIGEDMPRELLDAQLPMLQRLTPDERGLQLDVARTPEQLADDAMAAANFAEKAYQD